MKALFVAGRAVLGGFFVYSGIHHFLQASKMADYVRSKNLPAPKAGVYATGAVLAGGGASLLLGVKPKLGSAALAAFLAAVSTLIHDFWRTEDPQQREKDFIDFEKNIALLGAVLALMAVEEPWPASVPIAQPGVKQRVRKAIHALAA